MNITDFMSWESMGTYAGALVMVGFLTQLTKNIPGVKKIPTQLWTYILAFTVMFCAKLFLGELTMEVLAQNIFDAGIASLAANGGYQVAERCFKSKEESTEG